MKCKVSFEFESDQEMTKWLNAKTPMASVAMETMENGVGVMQAAQAEEPKAEEPKAEEPVKAKAPKAPKAPAAIETLNPEALSQKEREKAKAIVVGQIRGFVLEDKSTNMRALLPLMPEGKKALDALTLEEAQEIVLKLGIE